MALLGTGVGKGSRGWDSKKASDHTDGRTGSKEEDHTEAVCMRCTAVMVAEDMLR